MFAKHATTHGRCASVRVHLVGVTVGVAQCLKMRVAASQCGEVTVAYVVLICSSLHLSLCQVLQRNGEVWLGQETGLSKTATAQIDGNAFPSNTST